MICEVTFCVCVCVQAAQVVLIALFELNTPEFTMLLGALPKTFQDGTTKLLHNHLRNASGMSMVTHTHTRTKKNKYFPVLAIQKSASVVLDVLDAQNSVTVNI